MLRLKCYCKNKCHCEGASQRAGDKAIFFTPNLNKEETNMAINSDGLARNLSPDVRTPADIGEVIQLHKPKLWKRIVGLMIGAVASLTILFVIAHFVFSPSGRFGLITPSGNSMSSTFPEGSWALTVPASWVKPQDGSFVVAYYNGDKIPETPQDAKPGLVIKIYNKNQQELVSPDYNDTYPANDIRGVVVAYIPIQKLARWRDTGAQEMSTIHKQYLARASKEETDHRSRLAKKGLSQVQIQVHGYQQPRIVVGIGEVVSADISQFIEFFCPTGQLYYQADAIITVLEKQDGDRWVSVPVKNEGKWKVAQVTPGAWRFHAKNPKGTNYIPISVYKLEVWAPM